MLAAELPSRKAGLWEVRTSFENRNGAGLTVRQYIDASTDQMMESSAGRAGSLLEARHTEIRRHRHDRLDPHARR
jgi:hypothetical protein